jgi:outer membrane protein OmpA-like peptidoglycan-associated protein
MYRHHQGKPNFRKVSRPLLMAMAVLMVMAQGVRAQGLSLAPFLRISPYARQVGMGEAFTAMTNDINMMRYNVGGLGTLRYRMLSTHFHSWIDDTYQGAVEVAWPLRREAQSGWAGVLGMNLTYFNEGKLVELGEDFRPNGKETSSSDLILAIAYGLKTEIIRNVDWAIGAGPKFIRQSLAGTSANGIGLDVGTLISYKEISLGATLQNFTVSKMKFIRLEQSLPETFRAGVAFKLPLPIKTKAPSQQILEQRRRGIDRRIKLNLAADVAKVTGDDTWRVYTGAELRLAETFALRGGYKVHDDELSRWSAGFGLILPLKSLSGAAAEVDYAYTPMEAFDSQTHRFSLTFNFGVVKDEVQVVRIDTTGLSAARSRIQQELARAEKARQEMEESQQRMAEMEAEMARRLERAKEIAATSEGKIEVEPKEELRVLMTLRINFDFDKSDIRPSEFSTMQKVAEILNTYPDSKVFISGHADSIGTYAYNYQLSQRRMNSVMAYLENKHGIKEAVFFMPVGYGEVRPLEDNGTSFGRSRNRRVEFLIYPPDVQPEIPDASMLENLATVEDSLFGLKFNGKVKFSEQYMSNPARLVIDLPDIYLPGEFQNIQLNRGDFIGIRAAYHPEDNFTRVVFDLRQPIRLDLMARADRLVVKDQSMVLPTAVKNP